jgi:hypothetical protein
VEDNNQEDPLTDRIGKENGPQLSVDEDEESGHQSKRRSAKSVDHTRGNYSRKSADGQKRTVRQSPSGGGGAKKKVNLDAFSMASGGSKFIVT